MRSPGGRFARKGTRKSAAQWRERNEDFVAVGCCATCATRLSYELDYEPGNEKRVRTGTRHWSPRARRVRRAHRHPHGVIPVYRTSLASPIRPIRLPLEHHRVHDLGLLARGHSRRPGAATTSARDRPTSSRASDRTPPSRPAFIQPSYPSDRGKHPTARCLRAEVSAHS